MGKRKKLTAHNLIRPALEALIERIQRDAKRVVGSKDDDEAVHDFRVGLRRLRTLLRAARTVYGKKKVKRLEAQAKAFGDATSALRDAEVLADTLGATALDEPAQQVSSVWLAQVQSGEAELRAAAVDLIRGPDLGAMCEAVRKMLRSGPVREQTVGKFAEARFDDVRFGVRELLPVAPADIDRLHRLRIRFKRLRYTCEMLAQFMTVIDATGTRRKEREHARHAGTRFATTGRNAARMQKALGLLHDADQALLALAGAEMSEDDRLVIRGALTTLRGRIAQKSIEQLAKLPKRIVGTESVVAITGETQQPAPA